ncbi:hypothetical protein [Clostridium fallax]|nr:hypothetical protein [Clostridium fallax]
MINAVIILSLVTTILTSLMIKSSKDFNKVIMERKMIKSKI